jgi:hypothetical protein
MKDYTKCYRFEYLTARAIAAINRRDMKAVEKLNIEKDSLEYKPPPRVTAESYKQLVYKCWAHIMDRKNKLTERSVIVREQSNEEAVVICDEYIVKLQMLLASGDPRDVPSAEQMQEIFVEEQKNQQALQIRKQSSKKAMEAEAAAAAAAVAAAETAAAAEKQASMRKSSSQLQPQPRVCISDEDMEYLAALSTRAGTLSPRKERAASSAPPVSVVLKGGQYWTSAMKDTDAPRKVHLKLSSDVDGLKGEYDLLRALGGVLAKDRTKKAFPEFIEGFFPPKSAAIIGSPLPDGLAYAIMPLPPVDLDLLTFLKEERQANRLSAAKALRVVPLVLEVVAAAHSAGYVFSSLSLADFTIEGVNLDPKQRTEGISTTSPPRLKFSPLSLSRVFKKAADNSHAAAVGAAILKGQELSRCVTVMAPELAPYFISQLGATSTAAGGGAGGSPGGAASGTNAVTPKKKNSVSFSATLELGASPAGTVDASGPLSSSLKMNASGKILTSSSSHAALGTSPAIPGAAAVGGAGDTGTKGRADIDIQAANIWNVGMILYPLFDVAAKSRSLPGLMKRVHDIDGTPDPMPCLVKLTQYASTPSTIDNILDKNLTIKGGDAIFDGAEYGALQEHAKELVRSMLRIAPGERPTAEALKKRVAEISR